MFPYIITGLVSQFDLEIDASVLGARIADSRILTKFLEKKA